MRAQSPPSFSNVSPLAGSRNSGIQGSVSSPLKVERPSSSPPGALTAAGAAPLTAGAFLAAVLGVHAGKRLTSAQPANEGKVFFIVKGTVFFTEDTGRYSIA